MRAAVWLFSILIGIRLFNEVWSNTMVIGSYFGDYGSLSSQAERDALINPLLDRMLIKNDLIMDEHPDVAEIRLRLDNDIPLSTQPANPDNVLPEEVPGLIQTLSAASTQERATAVCTAVLSNAAMLMQ